MVPEIDYSDVSGGSYFRRSISADERESESRTPLKRSGSLRSPRKTPYKAVGSNLLQVPIAARSGTSLSDGNIDRICRTGGRGSELIAAAPAPARLAISLLQLGTPIVSMPRPQGEVGTDTFPSSDSDDSSASQSHRNDHGQSQGQQGGQRVPKVHVSGPPSPPEPASIINGSAGSIGARSAPSTPLQSVAGPPQSSPQSISGSQLTVAGTNLPPQRSPSHTSLKCSDSQLSKPLSRSVPSMAAGVQTPAKDISRSSSRSSPTTSSARQKKFHRHFTQVADDERVLNYYSCALVGDILLQGHLYITPNYFAFYSNVFGYVTKLLIPTTSVLKISKEKTARIIPNAVAVATEDERHVFCSLLSRDSTFKLMKQVWDAAMEARPVEDLPLPLPLEEVKLIPPNTLLVDDSEVNPEEDDSSMSESGPDLKPRPSVVCVNDDNVPPGIPRATVSSIRVDQVLPKSMGTNRSSLFFLGRFKSSTVITVLVALLAVLYLSAALMMIRIDRLHTMYLNHPFVSPERFTQDRLIHYLNTNLDQITKVRQSLQTLSQQFVMLNQAGQTGPGVSGGVESEDGPS
ncbi:uncharacterized protein [Prorops nasuta]|uniref:uncharacterized protein isoform X2 n=1 Tax=Prorops nasuta TaxID=863751 RepID=UPI0034CD06C2